MRVLSGKFDVRTDLEGNQMAEKGEKMEWRVEDRITFVLRGIITRGA